MDNFLSGELEIREQTGREGTLYATVLQEGRAASNRRELFTPGSVTWAATGIEIMTEHLGAVEVRAQLVRHKDGVLSLTARATDGIRQAIADGKKYMSVEFKAMDSAVTNGGIREIRKAFILGAAMVSNPEYSMTYAELRGRQDIRAISERARAWLK